MPLRDHFRPPVISRHSWEGFHAQWPAMLVLRLFPVLPEGYTAEPRVRLGRYYELDIGGFEGDESGRTWSGSDSGGVATAPYVAPHPTLTVEVDLGEQYEYEVLVFDDERDRTLVAAVEFVSPANKDRPEHRQAFVTKCAALLQKGVCVSIVDLVTVRQFNLYGELLELIGRSDPALGEEAAAPLRGDHAEPLASAEAARPRHVVLPARARPTAAAASGLAQPGPRDFARPGRKLRGHLPRLADRVTPAHVTRSTNRGTLARNSAPDRAERRDRRTTTAATSAAVVRSSGRATMPSRIVRFSFSTQRHEVA